jgi:hypothetical protein
MGEKIRCVMCGREERQHDHMTEEALATYHCTECSIAVYRFYLRESMRGLPAGFGELGHSENQIRTKGLEVGSRQRREARLAHHSTE